MTGDTRRATLVSVVALDGLDESAVLSLAAGVAGGLDAAIAAAILDSARERDIPVRAVDQLRDTTRKGVAGSVEGHAVVVGNAALFADLGLSLESFGDWPDRLRRRGEHVLFVAIDGRAAAFFGVANAPVENTDSEDKEESMQHSVATSEFPTTTNGLAVARSTESFELTDGQQFDLHISPVTKRFGDRDVRMLAYNGSIPGPTSGFSRDRPWS